MSKPIIHDRQRFSNQPNATLAPPKADLICPRPRCRATAHFSSAHQQVRCGCGWALALTAEETQVIVDALVGVTPDLDLPAYLVILNAERGGDDPPPIDHLATILLRRALCAWPLEAAVAA